MLLTAGLRSDALKFIKYIIHTLLIIIKFYEDTCSQVGVC